MDADTLGRRTELLEHDENGRRGVVLDAGEALLPAPVGIGKCDRLGEELVLRTGEMQFDPHTALKAGFGEQQVAARGPAAKTEVVDAGADVVEGGANARRRRRDLGWQETRRLRLAFAPFCGVVNHVTAEDD